MKKILIASLDLAAKCGYKSVALPAAGTGHLGFPRNVIADTMFKTVMDFSKSHPITSLKSVVFVMYTTDQQTIDVSHSQMKIDYNYLTSLTRDTFKI